MLNLILKDFKISKTTIPVTFCWWAFFIYLDVGGNKSEATSIPYMVISLALVFLALGIDDKNKMEKLFVSLPIKRSAIVSARYIFAFAMIGLVLSLTYVTTHSLNLIMPDVYTGAPTLKNLMGAQLVVIYITVLVLPVFFKYGAYLEDGMRVITIYIVTILLLLVATVMISLHYNVNLVEIKNMFLYCCIAAVILTAGSWLWSLRIYRKREF